MVEIDWHRHPPRGVERSLQEGPCVRLGLRERAAGLFAPSFYIAQFANPLIMQPLRVAVGIQAAFMLAGLALAAGAACAAWPAWAAAVKP